MKRIAPAVLLLVSTASAHAGWYQVTNYTGRIEMSAVHLSLQVHVKPYGYGPGVNVNASYYVDRQRTPVPLVGQLDNQHITLCNVRNARSLSELNYSGSPMDDSTAGCPIRLTLGEDGAVGSWTVGHRTLHLQLKRVGHLDDSGTGIVDGVMHVPFWGQTAHDMFVGIYQGSGKDMNFIAIRVIDKKTGAAVQEIVPPRGCIFGWFMTPIYMNLQSVKSNKHEEISLNCASPKVGLPAYYTRDSKTGKFVFTGNPTAVR